MDETVCPGCAKELEALRKQVAELTAEWKDASRLHNDSMDAMYKQVALLREALAEASNEISDWGQYASEYFQDKYKLAEIVDRFAKIAAGE